VTKKTDDEPGLGSQQATARSSDSSRFERVVAKGRKITLTLEGVALSLPGEAPARRPTPEASPRPGETSLEGSETAREPKGDDVHLDAWSVDRVRRSSFPPSATNPVLPPPADLARGAVHRDVSRHSALLEEHADDSEGDALALVGRRSRPTPTLDLVSEMSERFALGDFSGALRAAELVLGQDPGLQSAQHYAHESRQKLESLYLSRLSSQGRIPKLAMPETEIRWLGLDSRMGFLLSRIDGMSDYETILELSGMPRLEALRSLVELVDTKVIRIV
jgi:hypothetical protein